MLAALCTAGHPCSALTVHPVPALPRGSGLGIIYKHPIEGIVTMELADSSPADTSFRGGGGRMMAWLTRCREVLESTSYGVPLSLTPMLSDR
jgi:hypothetical protein